MKNDNFTLPQADICAANYLTNRQNNSDNEYQA